MQVINPRRGGNKCWVCWDDMSLDVCHTVPDTLRLGACYKQVPPIQRVGAFNDASLRISNCFPKRLHSEVKGWRGNGLAGANACLAQLQDCYKEVIAEASRITAAGRLAPRKQKEGAFDLTSSKVFLTSHPNMQKVVAAVRQVVGAHIGGVPAGVVVHLILLPCYRLYGFWRSKVYLSDAALAAAKEVQQTFAQEWEKTGSLPRTWVHWAGCHSAVFLSRYRSLYMLSTIATDKKNGAFKLYLGHLFSRWSITRPIYTRRGLLHLVNNHAVDLGLLLRRAQREGTKIQLKERRMEEDARCRRRTMTPPPSPQQLQTKNWVLVALSFPFLLPVFSTGVLCAQF